MKKTTTARALLTVIAVVFLLTACEGGKAEKAGKTGEVPFFEGLGDYRMEVTAGSESARRYFDQAVTLAWGFNHAEAARSFREAARIEPGMAMAHWGLAWVLGPNINANMDDANVAEAYAEARKALELAEGVSDRERALIRAMAERYPPEPVEDRSPYDAAYAEAMKEAAQEHGDDPDVLALYAEAVMDTHPWDYWDIEGGPMPWTPGILDALETAISLDTDHVGANHLYIHAVEASPQPERGLPSADRLGGLVPGIGHLVHMPSHIYIRTARYNDAVRANERAIEADKKYMAKDHVPSLYTRAYYSHNFHFLSSAAALEGRSELALDTARELASVVRENMMATSSGTLQHFYAVQMYTLVRFEKWGEIFSAPDPPEGFTYLDGVWHFARGMAAAGKGELEEAEAELEGLREAASDESLKEVKIFDINSTHDVLRIAVDVLTGEIHAARGDLKKAEAAFERAVRAEDDLYYDEPPTWQCHARGYLGHVLLQAGRPAEAGEVFGRYLERYPANGWALHGLYLSLDARGEAERAAETMERFEKAWERADHPLLRRERVSPRPSEAGL